ncbi:MAG: hypothetical protein AB8F74_15505 [Saprospiraceae bacterium]
MKDDKEKWIDEVLGSIKGSERAKPQSELFSKIEDALNDQEVKVIPMSQWGYSVAAAVLVLLLNIAVLKQYVQSNNANISEIVTDDNSSQSLVSNYKIYD